MTRPAAGVPPAPAVVAAVVVSLVVAVVVAVLAPAPLRGAGPDPGEVMRAALARVEAGELGAAIAELEEAREAGATSPRLLALLGTLRLEAGRPEAAFEVLAPLADAAGADPAVLFHAGRAALVLGRRGAGEEYLERSVALAPVSPAARVLGLLRHRQGRAFDAYRLLRPWALARPGDAGARLVAAALALDLRRPGEAEELLSDLPQDRPEVRLLWARLRLAEDDPEGALALLAPLGEAPAELEPELRRTRAEGYLRAGRPAEAVAELAGAPPAGPDHALLLARAHLAAGDPEAAADALRPHAERVRADPPGSRSREDRLLAAEISRVEGRILLALDRAAEAVASLERAVELDRWNPEGWRRLAEALLAAGRGDQSRTARDRAERLAAAEARVAESGAGGRGDATERTVREARLWLARGDAERALELLRREIALAPDDLRPRFVEVEALLGAERTGEALAAAERNAELAPESADAVYQLGVVRMATGELDEAETTLRRVLELAPGHTAAMNDLAVLLLSRGRTGEGRELLERVLVLRPDDPVAKRNLERLGAEPPAPPEEPPPKP